MPAARALCRVQICNGNQRTVSDHSLIGPLTKERSTHGPFNRRDMILRRTSGSKAMPEISTCKHEHTRLIAKDNEAEYIECVNCGAILETHELAEDPKRA